jgi:hypothetical protein
MNDREHDLRDRLVRLEHGMPAALPLDLEDALPTSAGRRGTWMSRGMLAGMLTAAVLAGAVVGGLGLTLLAPGQPRTPVLPAGLYRSSSPIAGPVCVMVELPMRNAVQQLGQTRVWWWPEGPDGCTQRSDFIYVQWVQPQRAAAGITLSLMVELRGGERHQLTFTLDPQAAAAPDGAVATFRDASGLQPGVRLVPTEGYDDIEEAPAP